MIVMKKNLYIILAGVVALASSCVKETEKFIDDTPKPGAVCITVKMAPETKATIAESDGAFHFSNGDVIKIFDGTAVKSGTTTSTDNTGSFAMEDGFNAEGSGYAGFPGSLVSDITADGVIFTLPTSYEYAAVGNSDPDAAKVPVPMMGTYTGGSDISLKQAGALIRFRVTNVAAGTLTFTFPTNVTGTLGTAITTPTGTNDGILAANLTSAGKTITVTGVPETTSGNYIFITLPVPTGTATAGIKVVNNSDSRMAMPSGSGVGLNRAHGYKMSVSIGQLPGIKGGKISVSSTKQVYFSQGNLQATTTDGWSTWAWSFMDHQYDLVETDSDPYCSENYADKTAVSLFGWGTSGIAYTGHASAYQPWRTSKTNGEYNPYNSTTTNLFNGDGADKGKADWGYNAITNGGNQTGIWRTLTLDEWDYLYNSRITGVTLKGTANARYTLATVNKTSIDDASGVNGVILFPDNYSGPTSDIADILSWGTINDKSDYSTKCTAEGWNTLEAAGCVFLPATGCRNGNMVVDVGSSVGYWSSSRDASNNDCAHPFSVDVYNSPNGVSCDRFYGCSVRLVRDASNVPDQDPGMLSTPLTFEAKVAGANVCFIKESGTWITLQYSTDGTTWTDFNDYYDITLTNAGDKVSFRAKSTNGALYGFSWSSFYCDKDCYLYGNIMSLLSRDDFATATSVPDNAFRGLFFDNPHILSHPSKALVLPATTLGCSCYNDMFLGCTALTSAPALPATSLAENCYTEMFEGCTSLQTAPALPATTLAMGCYSSMFSGCTSLQTAPALPATTLAMRCYYYMFSGCTSLQTAPALPATTLAIGCYNYMFSDCTSLETAPALPATTLADGCYGSMFLGCTALTSAPALPATSLAENCYKAMFSCCTSLVNAPDLPATTLAKGCYWHMFAGSSQLGSAPDLPATTLTENCYQEMFQGCTSLATAPTLPAPTLVNYCYFDMFEYCSNLNSVTCLATNISADWCTGNWLSDVAASGTFIKAPSMTSWTSGVSGIPSGWTTLNNLAYLTTDYTAQNGDIITGTLANNVKISIADGATVTLAGVSINADGTWTSGYAGITCEGDATINLAAGTTNTVKGIGNGWPGIYVPGDYNSTTYKTLTIQGTGTLNASGRDDAPGIGGAKENDGGNIVILGGVINASGNVDGTGIGAGDSAYCGDITISGGTVTATAGPDGGGAGIGTSGTYSRCRNILINGGTVIATGGDGGIGIGSGCNYTRCGRITIAATITSVTAIKGKDPYVSGPCIGKGYFSSQCGNIFFGSDSVYNGTSWTVDSSSGMPVTGGTYGGLNFTESTTNGCVTWTLTPTTPTM